MSPTDVYAWMINTVEQTKMSAHPDIDMLHETKCNITKKHLWFTNLMSLLLVFQFLDICNCAGCHLWSDEHVLVEPLDLTYLRNIWAMMVVWMLTMGDTHDMPHPNPANNT